MALSSVACEKQWFLIPWMVEKVDNKTFIYIPIAILVHSKDGDSKVLRVALKGSL
jgi:hypothetical protein